MRTATGRILIVDDEPEVCSLIRGELSEIGYDCEVATEPGHAQQLLRAQYFDLVISDIAMPGISGLDLLAHIREHGYRCKVVLVTGASKREYVAQALMLGAFDYVQKPFTDRELVEVVSRALEDPSSPPNLPARAAEAIETSNRARQASVESIQALVRAVEAKDPYTRRHSDQVAYYAANLAKAMGLDAAAVQSVHTAALLHDVGKIGVPDRILIKPGPLSGPEFEQVRRHPALGAEILSKVTLFASEAFLVRHHHERWDGQGYPDGLAGEECPLGARIIMVCDCIDAMLMDRTYKKGYSRDKMVQELIRCAGRQFDPKVAAAAVQWCQANPEQLTVPESSSAASAFR